MAFTLGKTEAELKAQRANTLREIDARGGKEKAPGYVKRLNEIDGALRSIRSGAAPGAGGAGEPFNAKGYLEANPDVAREAERLVNSGDRRTREQIAQDHWNANGKAEGRTFAPTSTPPVNPTNDPAPLGPLPAEITDVPTAINAEKTVADAQAKGEIAYGNAATETNPFGTKTTGFDENGRPVTTETLAPEQQKILDQQQQLSQTGGAAAQGIIDSGGLNKAFNPVLDDRVTGGDVQRFNEQQRQELEAYLTRNFDRDKARDLNTLETSLYNRGIPLDRQAEAYDRAIEGLNRDYDSRRADAAAQALTFGGEEAQRIFDMNENVRKNQLDEQGKTRQQNMSDTQTLSTLGSGVILPEFNDFRGGTYDLNSPTEVQLGLNASDQAKKTAETQRALLKAQEEAARRQGSGGGTGRNTGTVAQSPFVDA